MIDGDGPNNETRGSVTRERLPQDGTGWGDNGGEMRRARFLLLKTEAALRWQGRFDGGTVKNLSGATSMARLGALAALQGWKRVDWF